MYNYVSIMSQIQTQEKSKIEAAKLSKHSALVY